MLTNWQWERHLRQWYTTSSLTRQSTKKVWRSKYHHVLQPFFLSPLSSDSLTLSLFPSLSLWAVLCVPSLPLLLFSLSILLPLMRSGVCYPRVLVRCCCRPKARSGGHLKLRNAVCDIISHCHYSRLTSPCCLRPPGVWVLGGRQGQHTCTHTHCRHFCVRQSCVWQRLWGKKVWKFNFCFFIVFL